MPSSGSSRGRRAALLVAVLLVFSPAARGEGVPSALERRSPELERLAQVLRPIEERYVHDDPARRSPAALSEEFHQLWVITRRGAALAGTDAALAKDLAELASESRLASQAADRANVEYPLRPEKSRDVWTMVRAVGTKAAAESALAHADRAVRALGRVMRRFPLYTADGAWGLRP